MQAPDHNRRFRVLPPLAGAVVILLGLLGLAGWAFDISALKSVWPGLVPMKANTAIALILAGVSLLLHRHPEAFHPFLRRFGQLCALIVSVIGVLTLTEHLLSLDLGIDQLLFQESLPPEGGVPRAEAGRMAWPTALTARPHPLGRRAFGGQHPPAVAPSYGPARQQRENIRRCGAVPGPDRRVGLARGPAPVFVRAGDGLSVAALCSRRP